GRGQAGRGGAAVCEHCRMLRVNVLNDQCALDGDEPDGYRTGAIRITSAVGGKDVAVKVFEIEPGQSVCPYHYEYEEEWLLALTGPVTVRVPAGEETLQAGEIVCFPAGAEGAHKVSNP